MHDRPPAGPPPAYCGTCGEMTRWEPFGYFCQSYGCPNKDIQIRPMYNGPALMLVRMKLGKDNFRCSSVS